MEPTSPDPIERLEALAARVDGHARSVPELAEVADELRTIAAQLDASRNPQ